MPGAFAKARMKAREDAMDARAASSARAAARIGGVVGRAEAALREPLGAKAVRLVGKGGRGKRAGVRARSFFKKTGAVASAVSASLSRAGSKFDRTAREFENRDITVGDKTAQKPLGGSLGSSIFGASPPPARKKQKSVTIRFN